MTILETVSFLTTNIVNHKVDGLVSTGNVYLNMSGGVNGELLSQAGVNMQKQMHDWLAEQDKKFVQPGVVMEIGPDPFDFKCVVYTVAVDAFYASSVELVVTCLQRSFDVFICERLSLSCSSCTGDRLRAFIQI